MQTRGVARMSQRMIFQLTPPTPGQDETFRADLSDGCPKFGQLPLGSWRSRHVADHCANWGHAGAAAVVHIIGAASFRRRAPSPVCTPYSQAEALALNIRRRPSQLGTLFKPYFELLQALLEGGNGSACRRQKTRPKLRSAPPRDSLARGGGTHAQRQGQMRASISLPVRTRDDALRNAAYWLAIFGATPAAGPRLCELPRRSELGWACGQVASLDCPNARPLSRGVDGR